MDGKINEIDPALVDYVEFYLLNYFKPGQYRVTPRATAGLANMQRIGCTSCHVPEPDGPQRSARRRRRDEVRSRARHLQRPVRHGDAAVQVGRRHGGVSAAPADRRIIRRPERVHGLEAARSRAELPRARLRRHAHHESRHRAAVGRRNDRAVRARRPQHHARCGDSPPRRRSRGRDTRVPRASRPMRRKVSPPSCRRSCCSRPMTPLRT